KWMISKLHAWFVMYTDFDSGWGERAWPNTRPETALPADRPPTRVYDMSPGTITAPLHYEIPVTGAPVFAAARGAPARATATLDELAQRLSRLEDARAVEYLHNAFGYYLDRWQWDDVSALFADDGTIELAQRGVYAGRARVRAFLNLFGE